MAYVLSLIVHAVAVSEYLGCITCYASLLNKINYKVSLLKSSFDMYIITGRQRCYTSIYGS